MSRLDGEIDSTALVRLVVSAGGAAAVNAPDAWFGERVPASIGPEWPRTLTLVRAALPQQRVDLRPEAREALRVVGEGLEHGHLGRASREALLIELVDIAHWSDLHHDPARGPVERLVGMLAKRHVDEHRATFGDRRLRAERRDDEDRGAARASIGARDAYLTYWSDRVARLQRAREATWDVPHYAPRQERADEIRRELLARLLEAVADPANPLERFERPGEEATFRFLGHQKDRMRSHTRMHVVPATLDLRAVAPRTLTPEEQLAEAEGRSMRDGVLAQIAAARGRFDVGALTRSQLKWLDTFSEVAHAGVRTDTWGFATEAARRRGKHRSSATRALAELRHALGGDMMAAALAEQSAQDDLHRPAAATDGLSVHIQEFLRIREGCEAREEREILKAFADLAGIDPITFGYYAGVSFTALASRPSFATVLRVARAGVDRGPWSWDD